MNSLGERLISDAGDLINSGADIDDIREAMNSVYRHFKGEITDTRPSDKRLIRVFKLERLMKDKYLPLDTEPIYDEFDDVHLPEKVESEEDCYEALRFLVHETRKELSRTYDLKTSSLEHRCIGTSGYVSDLCEKCGLNDKLFSLDTNLGPGLFHCFNVVSFNVGGKVKNYLVDCTYRQFFSYADAFMERIGMPYNDGGSIGAYMMMDEGRKKIAEQLLTQGYIEFNPEVAKTYFDSFVFSGRNGKYYEQLGKSELSKRDYEPQYTLQEYMMAIENGGLPEMENGRQIGVMENPSIQFDSDSVMPYAVKRNMQSSNGTPVKK